MSECPKQVLDGFRCRSKRFILKTKILRVKWRACVIVRISLVAILLARVTVKVTTV